MENPFAFTKTQKGMHLTIGDHRMVITAIVALFTLCAHANR